MREDSQTVSHAEPTGSFRFLQRFIGRQNVDERCELCGTGLSAGHDHVLELPNRRLHCVCRSCAILSPTARGDAYHHIPRTIRVLPGLRMSEWQWDRFKIPVNLAFFYANSTIGTIAAGYPSPAGLIETVVDREAWQSLVDDNPILTDLMPDVEALLIDRIENRSEYFTVPMDHCFRLIGLMRTSWHGLSGGSEAKQELDAFFGWLKEQAHA
jgi:Family of unknown function (DUF5947)